MGFARLHRRFPLAAIVVAGLVPGCRGLLAQPGVADAGEFNAFTGGIFGNLGMRPLVGGSAGIALTRNAVALLETTYAPLGSHTLRRYEGITAANSNLYDFNFSLHIRIPVKRRWVPYAILGCAVLYNTYTITSQQPEGPVHLQGQSDAKLGFEAGPGVRYYVSEKWGVLGEYRYTATSQGFSRMNAGVFYQFEGGWPFRPRGHGRRPRLPY